MRNKKSFLTLVILALVLILGVGYAAVSGVSLSITGTVSTADETLDVYFTGTPTVSNTTGNVVATGALGSGEKPLAATIEVSGLSDVGDTATVTYTVKNDDKDLAAAIAETTREVMNGSTDLSDYFEVTTDYSEEVIAPNGQITVAVTVRLAKLPIEAENSTANITIEFDATPVQPESND